MLPRVSWRIDTSRDAPSARWAHTLSSCNGTAAILVAGFTNATYLDDAWIARARGTGLVEWLQPFPTYGCALPARSNHAAIALGEGRVVVSGGGGPQGLKHGDMFLLTLDADDGLLCQRVIHAPPGGGAQLVGCERSFHGGARLCKSIFCLVGGSSLIRADTNDVRLCSLVAQHTAVGPGPSSQPSLSGGASSDVMCHTESFRPSSSGSTWPSERRLHAMAHHELSSAVILHGGCTGPQFSPLGDVWVLQPALDRDRGGPDVIVSVLHAGLCLKWEKPPCISGCPPLARCGHSLTAIPGSNSFVMFGGSVDGRQSSALPGPGEDVVRLVDTADLFILTVVLAAPPEAEGTRGSSLPRVSGFEWTRVAAPFTVPRPLEQVCDWPEARRRHGAAVLAGYFCVFGGYDGAVYLGRTHCVPVSELLGCADATRAHSAAAAPFRLPVVGGGAGLASADTWGDFDPFGSASAAAPVPVAPAALSALPPQSDPFSSIPFASCADRRPFDPSFKLPVNAGPSTLAPTLASLEAGTADAKNIHRKAIPRAWIETCAAAVAGLGFKASTVAAAVAALEASPEGIAPYASPDALAEYVCAHVDDLVKAERVGQGVAALASTAARGSVVQSSIRGSQADVLALLGDEVRGRQLMRCN